MDRRRFLLTSLAGALAAPPGAEAQQSARRHRIGILVGSAEAFITPYIEILRQELRNLGYVEGRKLVMEYRYADGNYDRLPTLAADLVRLKVDIIVTEGTPPTRAAK
jgi:ABC-type sugar transport system substrate-binding protein